MNGLNRETRGRRWLLIMLVAAAAVRVGYVTVRFSGAPAAGLSYPDEEAYCGAARSLAAGTGLVDKFGFRATYMPCYPAFLALFQRLPEPEFWARIVQALVGAWVAPATCLLARRWVKLTRPAGAEHDTGAGGERAAILAGLAVAFDPFLIFFSGLLLSETLFAAALVTAWVFVLPMGVKGGRAGVWRALPAGLMLWVCVMLRPAAAVLVVLAPAAAAVCRRFDRGSLLAGTVLVGIVAAKLVPWAARNREVTGQRRWLTTRGGISLYDGLRVGATGASDLAHTKVLPETAGLDEIAWDRYFRSQAWSAARRDPMRVVRLAWRKFARTWSLVPNVAPYQRGAAAVVSGVWMAVVLASAAVGWWTRRRAVRAWVMLLLPVAAFTLLHMIFVGSVRYRVPVMPMVMVLSGAGAALMLSRSGAVPQGEPRA